MPIKPCILACSIPQKACKTRTNQVEYQAERNQGESTMEHSDKALDHYWSLDPTSFDLLERFDLRQQEIGIDTYSSKYVLSLELWLRTGRSDDQRRLHLIFDDVQQLHLKAGGGYLTLPLVIRSLRQDQWEYLRYRVMDREEETLSLYSRRFEAHLLEEAQVGGSPTI
jgi:hypothetical protein